LKKWGGLVYRRYKTGVQKWGKGLFRTPFFRGFFTKKARLQPFLTQKGGGGRGGVGGGGTPQKSLFRGGGTSKA
jgi:hypothetical protein